MRQIVTLADQHQALRLADHLLTLKIVTRLEPLPEGWAVWICDEDRVEQARQELEQFTRNPDDPRYRDAARIAQTLRQQEARAEKKYRKNFIDVSQRWGAPSPRHWPLTLALIVISVAVGLLSRFGDPYSPVRSWFSIAALRVEDGAVYYRLGLQDIRDGEIWRVVTPIFLHFTIWHLLFNMMWLYDLGRQIEFHRGTWRLILMVLIIAITSNLAQYRATGPAFGGMSGVVFGLFGYVWMKARFDPDAGLFISPTNVILMIAWFALCSTGLVGSIANWAHGVGLAVGVLIGLVSVAWRNLTRH